MTIILLIIVLLLVGGGGGFALNGWHAGYGLPGGIVLVLIILLVFWALGYGRRTPL